MLLHLAAAGVLLAAVWVSLPFPMSKEKALANLPASGDVLETRLGCVATVLLNPQGVSTYVRRWRTGNGETSKGAVIIVHGLTWHSEYFGPLAMQLAGAGFDVVAYDLQGHGRSGTIDGMKGCVWAQRRRWTKYYLTSSSNGNSFAASYRSRSPLRRAVMRRVLTIGSPSWTWL